MTYIQAFIIAIIEGLTEFLPISSTAHMKIANPLLHVAETPFTNLFEVFRFFADLRTPATVPQDF